jgi:O-antigen ligase
MNGAALSRRYHAFVLVLLVVVYFINLPGYSATIESPLPRLFGAYTFLMLLLPVAYGVVADPKRFKDIASNPLTYWCYGYLVLALLWFPLSGHSLPEQEAFKNRIASVLYMIGFLMLFSTPWSFSLARKAIAFGLVIAAVLHVIDFAMPGLFVPVDEQFANPGRAAGLYMNANRAGAAIVLGFIVAWGVIGPRWRVPFLIVTLAGVALTFSRAATLALLLAFLILGRFGQVTLRQVGIAVALFSAAFLGIFGTVLLTGDLEWVAMLNVENIVERIEFFADPFSQQSFSTNERQLAALAGLRHLAEQPLLGHGIGATYAWRLPVSTHNIYLYYAVEYGVLGLLVFPLLILACVVRADVSAKPWVTAWACVIAFFGLFTHNALEDSAFLILYAVLASAYFPERSGLRIDPAASSSQCRD